MAQTTGECQYVARTAFQYFHQVCAPALSNYGSRSFWTRLVLQACHHDESIKHLVLAASCLAAEDYPLLRSVSSKGCPLYLTHYGKALGLLSRATSPDPALVLMACVLLILCNELRHDTPAALQHMVAGKNILASYTAAQDRAQSSGDATIAAIAPIFSQLERYSGALHHLTMAGHSPVTEITDLVHVQEDFSVPDTFAQDFPDFPVPEPFANVDDAAVALQAIASACTAIPPLDGAPPQTTSRAVPALTARLDVWLDRFTSLEASLPQGPPCTIDHQILHIYHTALRTLSCCVPYSEETAFDAHTNTFEHLVLTCAQLVSFTKTRLIPILFLVATRCRNASLRRRAIEVLRQCDIPGQILASVALKVVQIEERGVDEPITCADVPETRRIRVVDIRNDSLGDYYILLFRRSPYTDATPVEYCSVPVQYSSSISGQGVSMMNGASGCATLTVSPVKYVPPL